MSLWNQPVNNGRQNINHVQRGIAPLQTVPYGVMGGASEPVIEVDVCQPVIVTETRDCLSDMPLAMAYVPWQKFQNLHNETDAFMCGTIFKDLDFEFCRKGCK